MKLIKIALASLLVVICSMFVPLIISGKASADTIYDDLIAPIGSLVIPNSSNPSANKCGRDLSENWMSEYRKTLNSTELSSFDNRVAWGVSYVHGYEGPTSSSLYIYWWESGDLPTSIGFNDTYSLNSEATHFGSLTVGTWLDCELVGGTFPFNTAGIATAKPSSADLGGWIQPFVLVGVEIDYPDGYEGKYIPTEYTPLPAKYVAMGDSFSSGEGNPPFESGTDNPGANECHRSTQAYPRLLQDYPYVDVGSTSFVACSGSTSNEMIGGKYNERPQIDSLSSNTEVVTVTSGGNDIGFSAFANECVLSSCSIGSSTYNASWSALTNSSNASYLPSKLDNLYAQMQNKLTAANTSANVLVVGYPYVAKDDSWTSSCPYFNSGSAAGAEALVDKLNEVISDAVDRLQDPRFRSVDVTGASSPFTYHELCTPVSYFYGVNAPGPNAEYSFHPTQAGQEAYYDVISGFLY